MKLEQSFTVDAPVQTVWEALIDVQRVAPCLPGAEVHEAAEDGSYKGSFTVKLGPTTAAYVGGLKMEDLDEASHTATMSARGTDKRGQGGATATIVSRVTEDADGSGTRVDVDTDFAITGKLARFGRGGMIQDVANRMLREFAANLEEEVKIAAPGAAPAAAAEAAPPAEAPAEGAAEEPAAAAPPPPPRPAREPAEPVSGISLLLGALMDRLKRILGGRNVAWVALGALVVLAVLATFRRGAAGRR